MGGPPTLARLASATGGRMTRNSNDLTLGYVRARWDLACRYTLGFYVEGASTDRARRVRVRSTRAGVRLYHPDRVRFRSESERRADRLLAALVLPELFESSLARAHLFPLEPSSPGTWKALMAVGFPVSIPPGTREEVVEEFRVVLLRNRSKVVHQTGRRIRLRATDARAGADTRVTFVEALELEPGAYTLTLVRTRGDDDEPESASFKLELEPVPKGELLLIGPVLGKPAGDRLLLRGPGTIHPSARGRASKSPAPADRVAGPGSFAPLLVQQASPGEDLFALTQVCAVGRAAHRRAKRSRVLRSLRSGDGTPVGALAPVSLRLDRGRVVRCQPLLDAIATAGAPEGVYRFEAQVETLKGSEGAPARGEVEFTLEYPPATSESERP